MDMSVFMVQRVGLATYDSGRALGGGLDGSSAAMFVVCNAMARLL